MRLFWTVLFSFAAPFSAVAQQEPAREIAVPDVPRQADRHTTFLAPFDDPALRGASFAALKEAFGGRQYSYSDKGRHGGAATVAGPSAHLHFDAVQNVNPSRGTMAFWIKSQDGANIWADGRDHWIVQIRSDLNLELGKRGRDNLLRFGFRLKTEGGDGEVSVPVAALEASAWHHLSLSWDAADKRLWLFVNGKGVTNQANVQWSRHRPWLVFLGGASDLGRSDYPADAVFDDLHITTALPTDPPETPVTSAAGKLDMQRLAGAERGAGKHLNFWRDKQQNGGWGLIYSWPLLIPMETSAAVFAHPRNYVSNDKSWGTAVTAALYLYAGDVLCCDDYLEVAKRTGELYLAAQERDGAWSWGYFVAPCAARPRHTTKVKLQDSNQSHPLYLLVYLYRVTGDDRYLAGAKKAGELYLAAQNPNGSWSHSFDIKKGIGVTAIGLPQGGEINDNCMNDALEVMLLMYHLTGQEKYLAAIKRGGQWLLDSQTDGPTYAWAEQYDRDNNPVWARNFEPPAVTPGRSMLAFTSLRLMLWLTGEEKYRDAMRKFMQWVASVQNEEGRCWRHYDPKTGRPIIAVHNKIFFMDDPESKAAYVAQLPKDAERPAPDTKIDTAAYLAWLDGDEAAQPPALHGSPAREDALARSLRLEAAAGRFVTVQLPCGATIHEGLRSASIGAVTYPREPALYEVLEYIENARMALGELPLAYRGNGGLLDAAAAGLDWYDTPLRDGR